MNLLYHVIDAIIGSMKKSKKRPRVGIALLAYNQGEFIDEAIESLKKQVFQDFEVYLIDDGSNDGYTPEKLASVKYDKIVKKFLHKENIGAPMRRKEHDVLMQNDYILNFCGDDVLEPTFLSRTVEFLDNHEEYGAVSTNIRLFKGDPRNYFYEKKYNPDEMCIPAMFVDCNVLGSSLMRRKALDGIDLDWPLKRCYDWNRWIVMMDAGWKIGLVNEPLFNYRQVGDSLSHSVTKDEMIDFYRTLIEKHNGLCKEYSEDIIMRLQKKIIEMQEGKDWLDDQYRKHNKEIEKLNYEIKELNQKIENLEQAIEVKNGVIDELNNKLERQDSLRFLLKKRIKKVAKKY